MNISFESWAITKGKDRPTCLHTLFDKCLPYASNPDCMTCYNKAMEATR